jgi:signal peptidase I
MSVTPLDPPSTLDEVAFLPPTPPKRKNSWIVIVALVVAILIVTPLVIAVILRLFVIQTFFIPSGSMEPTLKIGDRIVVDKFSYHHHAVDPGDIVVFTRPPNENCGGPSAPDLVKRVVGLPGQTISLSHGYVDINGAPLRESWLPSSVQGVTYPGPAGTSYALTKPYVIPADHYFVMGDNRPDSCDSRYWGPIAKTSIVGKVVVRIWPFSAIHIF